MEDVCWVCLEGGGLESQCPCPRRAHPRCMAMWQAWRSSTPEETTCRFCSGRLPDWKPVLAPAAAAAAAAEPEFTICVGGVSKKMRAPLAVGNVRLFQELVLDLFGLDHGAELDVAFDCQLPGSPPRALTLHGWDTMDAAVNLATGLAATTAGDCSASWQGA